MAGRLDGKVAVITGAACGIGAGTAKRFIEEGARVVVTDLQDDAGKKVVSELGDNARFVRVDVTQEEDIAAAVDFAVSEFGGLDCMVNNAGIIGAIGPIAETDVKVWDATIAVLLRGVFLGMKHAARVMIPRKSGAIASLASTAGVMGGLGPHAYTAAKHAVVGLTKSAASELAQHGIRVNAVAPGNTVTSMTADAISGDASNFGQATEVIKQGSPLGIAGEPIDIANALLYMCCDESRYTTAHTLVVDAGQTAGGTPAQFHSSEPGIMREAGGRSLS